jgi:hypothetical protein
MNPWQAIFFGLKQIPRELTAFEIEAFFTFTATERQVISPTYDPLPLRSQIHRNHGLQEANSIETVPRRHGCVT